MHIFDELTYINNSSLALGFFDGIHQGHNVVLKNAINIAKKNNTQSCVITFKEHPLSTIIGEKIPLILTLDEKIKKLEKIGIDNVILLDFEKVYHLRAEEYLKDILIKYFSPLAITTGFNHSFGFNKEGTSDFLIKNASKYNYKYFEVPPFVIKENIVSCSVIRSRISLGDFVFANELLGYNFFIQGKVIHGEHLASKLGYPSANIRYDEEKIKIPHGVYYVQIEYENKLYNGVLNHGFAPTLNNKSELKTEVHLIDFDKNIYGENIKISFITKIREQMKFDNIDKLKAQILRDIAFADIYKHFLNNHFRIIQNKFKI